MNPILHARYSGNEVQLVFALETLLDDLHVQEPEKSAAEPEAECGRCLGLIVQGRVVQLKLLERVAQRLVLLGICRVYARENEGSHIAISRQRLAGAIRRIEDRVAGACLPNRAHVCDNVSDLTRTQLIGLHLAKLVEADLRYFVHRLARAESDLRAGANRSIHNSNAWNRSAIAVIVGVVDERAERSIRISGRSRHLSYDLLQKLGDTDSFLRTHEENVVLVDTEQIVDFLFSLLGLSAWQIDLVEHRNDLEARVESEKEVG